MRTLPKVAPASAAKVLLSQRGSLKELPHKSEMIIAVTKVSEENTKLVRELHEAIKEIDPQRQLIGVSFEEELGAQDKNLV
ncbi:MAG: hypothetical protein Ct9H90mP30_6630 [Actinomycetota bacterium]|nr:MAG: hypothetical protein Ct9H90mP30_6630 [Actinomycetota bacterium]